MFQEARREDKQTTIMQQQQKQQQQLPSNLVDDAVLLYRRSTSSVGGGATTAAPTASRGSLSSSPLSSSTSSSTSNHLKTLRSVKFMLILYSILSISSFQFGSFLSSQKRFLSSLLILPPSSSSSSSQQKQEQQHQHYLRHHHHQHAIKAKATTATTADHPVIAEPTMNHSPLVEPSEATTATTATTTLVKVNDFKQASTMQQTNVPPAAAAVTAAADADAQSAVATTTNNTTATATTDHSMRACIFVGNDNHLLAEWIAYHYTVLPMRHLIIGCDENATDDPHDVLKHWKDTDLNYEIWYPHNYTQNLTYDHYNALHRFRKRQPHFMGKCLQHFHNQGNLGWVALVDTDEYIKLNPLDDKLNDKLYVQHKQPSQLSKHVVSDTARLLTPNETLWDRIAMRKQLRQRLGLEPLIVDVNATANANATTITETANNPTTPLSIPTVLDVLEEYSAKHGTSPCHSISRLRYSAVLDNVTSLSQTLCTPKLNPEVASSLHDTHNRLSTIRFLYHAAPEHWKHNEWAKALIDIRRLSFDDLGKVSNPHQPLRDFCKSAYIHDMASFIHANHYINDLQVFAGRRGDTRPRNMGHWEKMAYLKDGVRCDQMHGWLNEFVQRFGANQAKQMLSLV